MAEVTVGTTTNALTGACSDVQPVTLALRTSGLDRLKRYSKSVVIAANNDTYSTGIKGLVRVAWEAGDTATVAPLFATEADRLIGKITFLASGAAAGIVHMWAPK